MYQMQEEKSAGRKDREVMDIRGHYCSLLKSFSGLELGVLSEHSCTRLTISM